MCMSTIDRIIGQRLRKRREAMGWSVEQITDKFGISSSELMGIEQGSQRLGAKLMMKACQALDVRPEYFFSTIKGEKSADDNPDSRTSPRKP